MKKILVVLSILMVIAILETDAQKIYHSSGAEMIFSGADVSFNNMDVNTNLRFTLFFHTQQLVNLDLTNNIGLFAGLAIRNVGLIKEDLYQNVGFLNIDNTHPDYNKTVKLKRRSHALGFPVALKLGSFSKHFFLFAGGEYEWMFHYKQKLLIDDEKRKYKDWTNDRVNPWIPSLFAGIQFPQGFRLKFKYYMDDFLNPDFKGTDFDEQVDYSQFGSTRIWYISLTIFLNKNKIKEFLGGGSEETAYRY
jgi:hypothetical protein